LRKVVLFIATSLDGQISRPDGGIDWLFHGEDYGYTDFQSTIDVWLLGRTTYEHSLLYAGAQFEGREVYVFSRRRAGVRLGGVQFVDDDPSDLVARLRERPGKDIWLIGGGELVSAFLERDLIDEIRLFVHPIVLGAGRPLFPPIPKERLLRLVDAHTFADGLVELRYVRER